MIPQGPPGWGWGEGCDTRSLTPWVTGQHSPQPEDPHAERAGSCVGNGVGRDECSPRHALTVPLRALTTLGKHLGREGLPKSNCVSPLLKTLQPLEAQRDPTARPPHHAHCGLRVFSCCSLCFEHPATHTGSSFARGLRSGAHRPLWGSLSFVSHDTGLPCLGLPKMALDNWCPGGQAGGAGV